PRTLGLIKLPPLDASTPPPPALAQDPPPGYVYAPSDFYPRGKRERELCETASKPDYLYIAGLAVLDGTAGFFAQDDYVKYRAPVAIRVASPAFVGVAWGATLGGLYLNIPSCDSTWVWSPPREGAERPAWQMAAAIAILSTLTAPIINGIVVGSLPIE